MHALPPIWSVCGSKLKGQRNIPDLYGIMARQVCHRARHLADAAIGTHGEAKPFHRLAEQLEAVASSPQKRSIPG